MNNKPLIIHPFLFAIFPVLSLLTTNTDEVYLTVGVLPAIVVLALASLMLLGLLHLTRDKLKAALGTSFFMFVFFSYGHMNRMLISTGFDGNSLLLFYFAILLIGGYAIIITKSNLIEPTHLLNFIAIIMVLISTTVILSAEREKRVEFVKARQSSKATPGLNIQTDSSKIRAKRDIYYIILDRYSSTRALEEFLDFDNSEFIDYLENRGFYVASKSQANYPHTYLSLASSLNLKHLAKVVRPYLAYEMVEDHKVWRFLKNNDYEFLHFGTWWGATRHNRYADKNYNYFLLPLEPFSKKLFESTLLAGILESTFGLQEREQRERLLYKFDELAKVKKINGPKFVFAHMLIPHRPYVFNQDGKPLTRREAGRLSDQQNYLNYIKFTNKKMKILIDEILATSEVKPIIIIQADEGYTSDVIGQREWSTSSDKKDLQGHMNIMNAYFLPDVDQSFLYETITPVNSFRLIFNLYFGTELPLLEDASFVKADVEPDKFENVTKKVRLNN